jgi:hypothetical protein
MFLLLLLLLGGEGRVNLQIGYLLLDILVFGKLHKFIYVNDFKATYQEKG